MRARSSLSAGGLGVFLLSSCLAVAQNWPSFRGTRAVGAVRNAQLPSSWDLETGRNVVWKISIPGLAHSSPVVWDDRIFLTNAVSSNPNSVLQFPLDGQPDMRTDVTSHQFGLMAIDRRTGKVIWNKVAYQGAPRVSRHPHNSYAAATPATDGKHVVAFFGSEGLYAFSVDGRQLWKQEVGILDQAAFDMPEYKWGYASSPIIYGNLAIIQCDQMKGSFIAAFDLETGRQVWRADRDAIPSWATPGIYEGKSGAELVTNGTEYIRGYDPLTGNELWRLKGTSMISVPTPFAAHELIYVCSGYWRWIQPIYAIKPGARGDITPSKNASSTAHIAWTAQKGASYLNTPIVYDDLLYVMGNNGVLACYGARTGDRIYQERVGKGYFTSSPVGGGGKLYFSNEEGDVYVVQAGPTFKLLGENHMGEVVMATPAITDNLLLFRTQHHLVALGESALQRGQASRPRK
jgi:outer membrane protein assembly factor BamB